LFQVAAVQYFQSHYVNKEYKLNNKSKFIRYLLEEQSCPLLSFFQLAFDLLHNGICSLQSNQENKKMCTAIT